MEDTKALTDILSGPGGVGILVLLGFCGTVLRRDDRSPAWAWAMIGAGIAAVVLSLLFLVLSSGRVFASWSAPGPLDAGLVWLSMLWVFAVAALVTVGMFGRRACQYLVECYHPDDDPPVVRILRRFLSPPSGGS